MMLPLDVEVFVASAPIDLRWSFDRLAGFARDALAREPTSGALFVFFGKRSDRVKILFHDRTGLCLFYKRLDRGTFVRLAGNGIDEHVVVITEEELEALLRGLDLPKKRRVH